MVGSGPTPARRNPVRYLMIPRLVVLSLIPAVPAPFSRDGSQRFPSMEMTLRSVEE